MGAGHVQVCFEPEYHAVRVRVASAARPRAAGEQPPRAVLANDMKWFLVQCMSTGQEDGLAVTVVPNADFIAKQLPQLRKVPLVARAWGRAHTPSERR